MSISCCGFSGWKSSPDPAEVEPVPCTSSGGREISCYIFLRQRGRGEGRPAANGGYGFRIELRRRYMGDGGGGVQGAMGLGDLRWRMEREALIHKKEEFNALQLRLLPIASCAFLKGFRESALRPSRANARGPLNAGEAWIKYAMNG